MQLTQTLRQHDSLRAAVGQVKASRRRAEVRLAHLAVDLGLRPGGHHYTEFVIVSRGRSGTNLLKGLLNDHPAAVCYGELFRSYGQMAWGVPGYRATTRDKEEISREPVTFLARRAYRRFPQQIDAVGFKLFYYHARNPEWVHVWSHLRNRHRLRVIHLRRDNVLATHLSLVRAQQQDIWEARGDERPPEPGPTHLDFDECRHAFESTREYEQWADALFAHQPKLDITYEALCDQRSASVGRVFRFLGLEERKVEPVNARQRRRSLAESIANYDELRRRFAGTEWSRFFTD